MDGQSPGTLHHRPASIGEAFAILAAGVVGLCGFPAGLLADGVGRALQGLALFFATFFYTLVRAFQLRRVEAGNRDEHAGIEIDRQAVRTYRRAVDAYFWVDYLPNTPSGEQH